MFEQVLEPIAAQIKQLRLRVRRTLFGTNNEKLDFLMDSFYKLDSNQRVGVLAGFAAGLSILVILVIGIYFAQVNSLERELDESFAALHKLQGMRRDFVQETKRYDSVIDSLQRATQSLSLKPFVEKTSKSVQVTVRDLAERKSDLPADIAMADRVKYANINVDISKVSIPRLMKFMVEIERSRSFLKIDDLEIRARYQDNLYFDAKLRVRGYSVEQ